MATRTRHLSLFSAVVALVAIATATEFYGLLSGTLFEGLLVASHLVLVVLAVSLVLTKGDVAFRATLLSLVAIWLLFEYMLCEFLAHAH